MKIAFDHQIFTTQKYGGVSRYIVNLSKELLFLNQDVKIFSTLFINKYLNTIENKHVKGYGPLFYPEKLSKILMFINNYTTNKEINKWKPSVIHETYYSKITTSNFKFPKILTVHDMIHENFMNQPEMISKSLKVLEDKKQSILRADELICVSENTKKDLINFYNIDRNKISVIHLAVDEIFKNNSDDVFFETNEVPYLLFVGKRNGYKNFKSFILSIANSEILKKDFNIVYFGSDYFSKSDKTYFSKIGLKENQIIHKNGDDFLLKKLYQNAKAFVYPTFYEGFGLPPLEAMANNCPVIASNRGSIPEILGDAAEFFEPDSIESMILAIEHVVYSEQRSKELIKKGADRYKQFSWTNTAKKTLEVYQKCS
jgi:glycosyltransferase involved in cell wall biosynthesis